MSAAYTPVIFGGISLNILSLTPIRTQKTIKQVIGKTLTEIEVIGVGTQQWELTANGICLGTTAANLSTNRAAIEALDDVASHSFSDGIHDGTFYIKPSSLKFNDSGDDANKSYTYSIQFVEE